MNKQNILIVGAGAAGYFAAITAKEKNPDFQLCIVDPGNRPLRKVEISGGGRCNVTHACFDEKLLTEAYPRGRRELRGPFSRFQPKDTIEWFSSRGVKLKAEEDGRIFPVSDSSKTIVDCLENERKKANVELRMGTKVLEINRLDDGKFKASFKKCSQVSTEIFDAIALCTGGDKSGHKIAKSLGHAIEPLAPSLFTFEVNDERISNLSGLSVEKTELELKFENQKPFKQSGPLLITHWGLSGPAILKLSAFAAREMFENNYRAELVIDWSPMHSLDSLKFEIKNLKAKHSKNVVKKLPATKIPKRLWGKLCTHVGISEELRYADLSNLQIDEISSEIKQGKYKVCGKGVFKEEFVTCGGVRLSEVDMRKMESKLVKGLFFAGEILDIDGITGGFNFQNAWTTGYIAGNSL